MNNNRLKWYSANFDVGTPPQRRNLMIDTGSSWMWTYSADCNKADETEFCQENTHRFQTKDSETFRYTGGRKYIKYGSGSSEGPICIDTVAFPANVDKEQNIEVAANFTALNFKFFVELNVFPGGESGEGPA